MGFALLCGPASGARAERQSDAAPTQAISSATAAAIDAALAREMANRHIAGAALAVIRKGQILYAQGYGMADRERAKAVTPDTRLLIASITKMFTAVATMMLVEEGKLSPETAIGSILPNLPKTWHPVTVKQLLNHTGGIPNFTDFESLPCPRLKLEAQYAASDVLGEVSCLPVDFVPGSNFHYSNTGYHLLGLIIERTSGRTYEAFLTVRIFRPLGMTSTRLMKAPGDPDDIAVGYYWQGDRFRRGPQLYPMIEMSAGGLVSTVGDLARFDRALATERLLPRKTLERMWKPAGVGSASYGMGFASRPIDGRPQVGHTGGGPAAATSFARFVDDDVTVILLTNTGQPPMAIQGVVDAVADAVLGDRVP